MSTILGLDLSLTSTGYCVLEDGEIKKIGTIKTSLKGVARLDYISEEICKIKMMYLEKAQSIIVAIEGYSYNSKKSSHAHAKGELGGIIKLFFHRRGIKTILVPPNNRMKFIGCKKKGEFNKVFAMKFAYKKYSIDFKNTDECDAYCLAKMGQAYLEGTDIKYEQEALAKVEVLA